MIEINLLPLELREKKKISIPLQGIFKTRLIFVVLGSLFLFHLLLISLGGINARRLNSLKKTWAGLSFEREQLEQLKQELKEIDARIPLIEQLISKRILWSNKLNRLNDAIVTGVWLNELSLETKEEQAKGRPARGKVSKGKVSKFLIIRGSCASRTKDEPALIGRFMQNLKDDPSFSADFAEIELGPIKKRKILQTEVMDFHLICRFN